MNNKQKSCLPVIASLLLLLFISCFVGFWIYAFSVANRKGILQNVQWEQISVEWFFGRIFPLLFFLFAVVYIGVLIISLFPNISITQSGINFRSLLTRGEIKWGEITGLKSVNWLEGYSIIIFRRKGASLFRPKGLLVNYFHGIWLGTYAPILLITKGTSNYREVVSRVQEELTSRLSIKE